jgi:hypothetical protein
MLPPIRNVLGVMLEMPMDTVLQVAVLQDIADIRTERVIKEEDVTEMRNQKKYVASSVSLFSLSVIHCQILVVKQLAVLKGQFVCGCGTQLGLWGGHGGIVNLMIIIINVM